MSEMKPYAWVSDGSVRKFYRAVAQLQAEKKTVTEDAVKDLYVKYGGLVIEASEEKPEEDAQRAPRTRRSPVESNEE